MADIWEGVIPPSSVSPSTFKGTYVTIHLMPNKHANQPKKHHENQTVFFGGELLAVDVVCKGKKLGMLPELYSVTEWKGAKDKWTKAVEDIRTQLDLEYCAHGYIGTKDDQKWSGFVAGCRYIKDDGLKHYKNYEEFLSLTPEEQAGWKLEQVSVSFPV